MGCREGRGKDYPSSSLCSWCWCAHTQSCVTFCDPMDCSLPGSSVPSIFQTRILEWVAISFSKGASRPRDWTHVSFVSCISRQIFFLFFFFTTSAIWEALGIANGSWLSKSSPWRSVLELCHFQEFSQIITESTDSLNSVHWQCHKKKPSLPGPLCSPGW